MRTSGNQVNGHSWRTLSSEFLLRRIIGRTLNLGIIMQKIPLNLARPGMVLEKPVLRNNGLVLVAQGTEISDGLLVRLGNMGVNSVTVEGHPVAMEGESPPKSYQERIDSLDHLFRRYKDDPWMNKMKGFISAFFKRKMAAEKSSGQAEQQSGAQDKTLSKQK